MKRTRFYQQLEGVNMSTIKINNQNVTLQLVNTTDNSKIYTIDGSGDVPNGQYNLTMIAKPGYLISKATYINSNGISVSLTISTDNKTATKNNFSISGNINFSVITTVEQPSTPPNSDGVSGFNHLYLVDKTILSSLSKERFTRGIGDNQPIIDLGQYIVNVLEFPFPVAETIKGLETQITLGNNLIQTKAIELLDDEVMLYIGKITVPKKYNNSYDYLNTNIYLHLPFVKTIELDINYVINQTITIQYLINLFTGETTIIVRSTKINNEIFYSENVRIGKEIPFVTANDKIQGNLHDNTQLNNQLYSAFLEVVRNKPHDVDNRFNDDMTIQTQLSKESGFVTVNKIILDSKATLQEKNMIESILKSGVYIK